MTPSSVRLALLALTLVSTTLSATTVASGRAKTERYLQSLGEQVRGLETGLETIRGNIALLRREVSELDALEKDQQALVQKTEAYLRLAQGEVEKNEALLAKAEAAKATGEVDERKRWKEDSVPKVEQAQKTFSELRQALENIGSLRRPAVEQLQSWTEREESYRRALTSLQGRRVELEKLYREDGARGANDAASAPTATR